VSDESEHSVERGCECTDCHPTSGCTGENAPVAYLVERDGEQFKVCTRCILPRDRRVERLIDEETPAEPYFDYDALGAMSLGAEVKNGGETA